MANNVWIGTTSNWGTAGNWSLAAAPVSTNNVYLDSSSTEDIDAGLSQSAVVLASLNIDMTYTGLIGTSSTYLDIGGALFNIGNPSPTGGNGSRRINIDCADASAVVNVKGSGNTAADTGFTPVRLLGTTLALNCSGGTTGVALGVGETSSVTTLNMTQGVGNPIVRLGAGNTLTTGNIYAGSLYNNSANATTTIVLHSGSYFHGGTGAHTTLTCGKGTTAEYNGTGTITTLNVSGIVDFSGGTGAVTVTNCNVYEGGTIIDPLKRCTFTNPIQIVQAKITDVTLDLGWHRTVQVA